MAAPLKVALTGGIASGKSAASEAFARLGVPIVDTDRLARALVEPGRPELAAVVAEFGPGILGPDGRLDRRRLRTLVFADEGRRRRLEAILHPAIRAATAAAVAAATAPYVVVAIPLLVESGQAADYDRVLVVDAAPETQRARLVERDGESPAGADAILAAQAGRASRLAVADDVLDNRGTLAELEAAVGRLHQHYLALARDPGSRRR